MKAWWQLDVEETISSLGSDLTFGLSSQEASVRLTKYGPNQLREKEGYSALRIFLGQFENFIIWVLIVAAVVSGFLKEWVDAAAIIAIVVLNAVLGFIQEYRAEKSLAALRKLSSPTSKVIRNGRGEVISSAELVPGDLIEVEAGDNVPADSRVVWLTANFSVQEASLTGESTPVAKTIFALEEKEMPLADRANMVYMGTFTSSGKAKAVVAETGMQTELGKIAEMVEEIKKEATPLQRKLEEFGKWIVYLCFILVGLVFLLEFLRGGKIIDVFLTAVSLAVAAIPEGLPAVVTIALALGVKRMVGRHALIRKLPSVETLGCATVICSDKTGTLTKNEMTVQAVFAGNNLFKVTGIGYEPKGEFLLNGGTISIKDYPDLNKALVCGCLCNGAELAKNDSGYKIRGDPTEASILTCAAKADLWKEKLEKEFVFVQEIPFDSERKKMTILRKSENGLIAFVKGAPDVFLNDCTEIEYKGSVRLLNAQDRRGILSVNDELTGGGMRVLAVGYRLLEGIPEKYEADLIENNLIFVGLVAMSDPPREEVKNVMGECAAAGIKTVMITGDHKNTAVAIAKQIGFFREDSIALTGEELDRLTKDEFEREVKRVSVYARVSPEHKLRIVRALRGQGEIVSMTGDGVNDAPALKEADIGVAMGITGTDVTKEVSDMVITDDNFVSIVAAIEEGRGIYDNIRKFIHYLLSCNAGEILVMLTASLMGMPVPLLPVQILWVNLVTDGLPALALGVDTVDPNIMRKPPRPKNENVITRQRGFLMLAQGAFIAFCSLLAFIFVLFVEKEGLERARTAAFIVLSCSQLFHSFNCRSMTESLFKIGVFTNSKLVLAAAVSFLLQMVVVYVPPLQVIFKTRPLGGFDWLMVIGISSFPLWAMEAVKLANRRGKFLYSVG
jgi:Ca2+-transporting ATPase